MKWLFFLLLFANVGAFALMFSTPQDNHRHKLLPDVGGLTLAREQLAPTEVSDEGDPEPGSETTLTAQPVSQQELSTQDDALEVPAAESEPVQDPPSPPIPETTANAEHVTPSDTAPYCAIIGYVESRTDAEQISVRLRAMGLKPELQSERRKEQAGYWVLVPPQETRQQAVNIAKRLETAGVSDLWRFTSGDLAHAISLGLFRDEERAEVRKKEIEALGFDTLIQPRYRESTRYWLGYQVEGQAPLTQQDWQGLVKDYPQLVSEQVECP
ncbi:MAG: hypothetical protein ABW076_09535 [Candidatus Thiodiazotropha sp.]